MNYLHTMIRVSDPKATVAFFELLGLTEVRRMESEKGRFTLIFLATPDDQTIGERRAEVELTYNWPPEDGDAESYTGGRNFGHLAYRVDDIYATCQRLMDAGVTINRPPAPPGSETRLQVIDEIANRVCATGSGRLRVVVDGLTGAGKTTFADELASAIRARGRSTLRASLDDFKHPWRHARVHGYDRVTGEGYYRNAPDFVSAQALLLQPAGPTGTGNVALCAHDPLTGTDHRSVVVDAPNDAVLVVDGVFGMRPEYDEYWDVRIWLHAEPAIALARGIRRDVELEGYDEALRLHTSRYAVGEQLYIDEVRPTKKATVIIDNTDFDRPTIERA